MKQIDIPNEIKNRSNSIAYDFRQLLKRKNRNLRIINLKNDFIVVEIVDLGNDIENKNSFINDST
jgi:hypothetical protein